MFLTSFRNDFESIVYLLWYFVDINLYNIIERYFSLLNSNSSSSW